MGDVPILGTFLVLIGMALTLGVAAYLVLRISRKAPGLVPTGATRLVRPLFVLTILIVIGLVIWMGVRWTNIRATNAPQTPPAQFRVRVDFSAPETVERQSVSAYRVSGGSVNVGCNENTSSNVSFSSPPGATIQTASASWENLDGVVGHNAQASFDPHTATATGQIQGRGRNIFGDCSGGGHGELVLSGAFSTKTSEATGNRTLIKTAEETLALNEVVGVAVPQQVATAPLKVIITRLNSSSSQIFAGDISQGTDGKLVLSALSPIGNSFQVSVQENVILIKLVAPAMKP
jgi:hypothetical protein